MSGQQLSHRFRKAGSKKWHPEHLSLPDDITALGRAMFSNEIVPFDAPRFRGDFMLTSQGDKEQIFLRRTVHPGLTVLRLSQSVDDTAWASGSGRIYTADHGAGTVNMVTGAFRPGMGLVAVTPCDAGNAPATCPAPGFPADYLGLLNPWTGHISRLPVRGEALHPQGMLFAG